MAKAQVLTEGLEMHRDSAVPVQGQAVGIHIEGHDRLFAYSYGVAAVFPVVAGIGDGNICDLPRWPHFFLVTVEVGAVGSSVVGGWMIGGGTAGRGVAEDTLTAKVVMRTTASFIVECISGHLYSIKYTMVWFRLQWNADEYEHHQNIINAN
ncbi:hypothetical protein L249_8700 [Ophiocordyceps polyrhachis-furcata BCC 54312]|uniref:Uncharacterized protein n=1 Tax=Ophiocordyceps polyrhachis-furcata BCC 54312 TaxID=1330021 RepID=A0A367L7N0_9HYPO|nr:hypothetical protein L249_8700 [Ophiocordyceps polyrhachis-furcata BCC 54312]